MPVEFSGRTNAEFEAWLEQLPRTELNTLEIASYTRSRRRMMNDERVRRSRLPTGEQEATPERSTEQQTEQAPIENDDSGLADALEVLNLEAVTSTLQTPEAGAGPSTAHVADSTLPSTSETGGNPGPSRRSRNHRSPPKAWYLFPELHPDILTAVTNVAFFRDILPRGDRRIETEKDRNLAASFRCPKGSCRNRWSSGTVSCVVRRYSRPGKPLRYNVQVYNQHCLDCNKLAVMELDKNIYVERVSRLLKIWKGESVPPAIRSERITKPHEQSLCEGCKAGHCQMGNEYLREY